MYIYLYANLFIGLSRSMVQSVIVYGVNLFTMLGMQHVVYAKSSKVLAATSCCLLHKTLDEATLNYIVWSAFR